MSLERDLLRVEAKKVYKEQTKGIPKKSRMPFAQFFKDFRKVKRGHKHDHEHEHHEGLEVHEEDFNLEEVVSVDNNVAVETPQQVENNTEEKVNE